MHAVCWEPHGSLKMLELTARWMHWSPSSKLLHWWQVSGGWFWFGWPLLLSVIFVVEGPLNCLILLVNRGSWLWPISKALESFSLTHNWPCPVVQSRAEIVTNNTSESSLVDMISRGHNPLVESNIFPTISGLAPSTHTHTHTHTRLITFVEQLERKTIAIGISHH